MAWRPVALAVALLAVALWSLWAERYPQQERQLRVELQEQLEERLPAVMEAPADRYGLFQQTIHGPDGGGTDGGSRRRALRVLLVHGLDEPGGIWADLQPALAAAGFDHWEFRYPNDQAIDRSADLLASSWPELPKDLPLVLVGHSMGGLVIRDFVSRLRHPVTVPVSQPRLEGASVRGVILAGTPNQGSDWARVRVLLELRDQWAAGQESGFSPLAGLRDGTGAAKIDLQPGSVFLSDLNARPWPQRVEVRIIGGVLMASAPTLGDGVVPPDSLIIDGAAPPIMVAASHRGLLARFFETDDEPPAIPAIMSLLDEWASSE